MVAKRVLAASSQSYRNEPLISPSASNQLSQRRDEATKAIQERAPPRQLDSVLIVGQALLRAISDAQQLARQDFLFSNGHLRTAARDFYWQLLLAKLWHNQFWLRCGVYRSRFRRRVFKEGFVFKNMAFEGAYDATAQLGALFLLGVCKSARAEDAALWKMKTLDLFTEWSEVDIARGILRVRRWMTLTAPILPIEPLRNGLKIEVQLAIDRARVAARLPPTQQAHADSEYDESLPYNEKQVLQLLDRADAPMLQLAIARGTRLEIDQVKRLTPILKANGYISTGGHRQGFSITERGRLYLRGISP